MVLVAVSTALFLLATEGATRLYDGYISNKINQNEYDWGSRLEGYTIEKKTGVFRVLVLGDSVTYGQGVKINETFSKLIENLLNEDSKGIRYEVINTGFCGIDTTQELISC